MSTNFIINLFEGGEFLETIEHADALPPLGSIYFTEGNRGGAYEVEGAVFVHAKHGGFPYGWAVFVKRVPVESTPLGKYDPSYYRPDGDEL